MSVLLRSAIFAAWLSNLKDAKGKARILSRLDLATLGNFGDCRPVGEGLSEMRIDVGPGYRVYYLRRDEQTYLLLAGGDKSSQDSDIRRARNLAKDLKAEARNAKGKKDKDKKG